MKMVVESGGAKKVRSGNLNPYTYLHPQIIGFAVTSTLNLNPPAGVWRCLSKAILLT
jgi:hypothetical protein